MTFQKGESSSFWGVLENTSEVAGFLVALFLTPLKGYRKKPKHGTVA